MSGAGVTEGLTGPRPATQFEDAPGRAYFSKCGFDWVIRYSCEVVTAEPSVPTLASRASIPSASRSWTATD